MAPGERAGRHDPPTIRAKPKVPARSPSCQSARPCARAISGKSGPNAPTQTVLANTTRHSSPVPEGRAHRRGRQGAKRRVGPPGIEGRHVRAGPQREARPGASRGTTSRPRARRPSGPSSPCRASRADAPPSDGRRRAAATSSAARAPPTSPRCSPRSRAASARAAGSRSSSGSTTRLTSRPASASSAENTRPVKTHSAAWLMPTSRGQEPRAARLRARRRGGRTRSRSAPRSTRCGCPSGSVMVTPKPTAGPLMAAITGFFRSKMRSVTRPPPSRCSPVGASPRAARRGRRSGRPPDRSAPAQNARPAPVTMTARTASSASAWSSAAISSSSMTDVHGVELVGPVRG